MIWGNYSMDIILGNLKLNDCEVDIIMERYTRRDFKPHRAGDDMKDVGRKSYEFMIRGNIAIEKFKTLNAESNRSSNKLKFVLGEFDVICKRLEYKSNGDFTLQLLEDILPENDNGDRDEGKSKGNVYISDTIIDY